VSDEQVQLEETFRALGLSEEGARAAARGRGGALLDLKEPIRPERRNEPKPKGKSKKLGQVREALGLSKSAEPSEGDEKVPVTEAEMGLEEAFLRMGLPPGQAKVAAKGRR
jgi:hypothetical protein